MPNPPTHTNQPRFEAVRSYDGTGRFYVVDNHESDLAAARKSRRMARSRAVALAVRMNGAATGA